MEKQKKKVDIYITHNVRIGVRTKQGAYGYMLTFQKQSGELEKRTGYGMTGEITQNSIILTALEDALSRLTMPCDLTVYMDSIYISNMYRKSQLDSWYSRDFCHVRTGKIQDADKWKRIEELSRMHDIQSEYYTHHAYTDDLKKEIEQMVERGEKNAG